MTNARNYGQQARAAYEFANRPYASHVHCRNRAIARAIGHRAMRSARQIIHRLHADMCHAFNHPISHGMDCATRQYYNDIYIKAKRRYERALNRYENVMRPAALAKLVV